MEALGEQADHAVTQHAAEVVVDVHQDPEAVAVQGEGLDLGDRPAVEVPALGGPGPRHPDDVTGPMNLGNPGEFTILELAEKVIAKTGSKSKIEFRPLPSDDPTQRQPDITQAKSVLGWEPKVKLDEGLDKTIEYFDRLLRVLG